MTNVVTPPQETKLTGFKVFLAGAIDMGNAVDWQSHTIKIFGNKSGLIILNPRRVDFAQDKLDEQINWELRALENADLIFMWFPKDTEAPIAFLEAGIYMTSDKLLLGVEPGFYRTRNLELTANYYGVPIYYSLDKLIEKTLEKFEKRI